MIGYLKMVRLTARYAFTLLELLVALAIISLLMALIMAGIQSSRSAAARLQCQNHLRQCALALQNYAGTQGQLPPGTSLKFNHGSQEYLSWLARILPYVEHDAIWQQIEIAFKENPYFSDIPPHHSSSIPIKVFSCPTDSRTQEPGTQQSRQFALTAFQGVNGTDSYDKNGCLYADSMVRINAITDGTSNTLLIGERPPSADRILGWWYGGWGQDRQGEADVHLGARTVHNGHDPECDIRPYPFAPGNIRNQCDAYHFWSLHPGGANFAFADGSVRFLRYSAHAILPSLATRAGGETVELD